MKRYFKKSLLVSCVFLLVFAASFSLSAATEEVVKKSFAVSEGGTLNLDSDLGSIRVVPGGSDTINVEVIKKVRTSSESKAQGIFDDFKLDFNHHGADLTIEADYSRKNGIFSWASGKRLKVKFIITVPVKYNLELRTRGGSITVNEIHGNVKANTSGGSLNFAYIKGTLNGRTSGGSIVLEGCDGNVNVHTSGGGIRIGRVKGEVKATTSGGSIKVKEVMGTINATTSGGSIAASISKQPSSDCKLTTSGGSISINMREGIKAYLDAKTSGGSVRTDFPVTIKGTLSKRKLKGDINGGGPEIYLRTSGGSIKINKL